MMRLDNSTLLRDSCPEFSRPGIHSHNIRHILSQNRRPATPLRGLKLLLLVVGICCLGYYGYTLSDEYIYQSYENWAFDQQIAGHPAVAFTDYLREDTPFGFLVGAKAPAPPVDSQAKAQQLPSSPPRLAEGSLMGRVEINRLNLSAVVREGVDAKTLSLAVGHVPSTALPGQQGNFAIAAHRDTLFRALKGIRKDDLVTFQSASGTYMYQVLATKIVKPSDVSVLRSDGGGLIPGSSTDKLLTMITCYPFYYVGSAPKRFVVEGRLVGHSTS